ncbi:hypothetical protein SDC9_105707 [bioreactor metagenome]|uniref:Uncharacterized protein n=1 Tax=bioreactor metagenome TaxID=1076179 RepID=A0A645BB09_9ZZZZ
MRKTDSPMSRTGHGSSSEEVAFVPVTVSVTPFPVLFPGISEHPETAATNADKTKSIHKINAVVFFIS